MPLSVDYQYNSANQRVRSTLADGSYWLYTYDALGQVRSGNKYWADGTPVAGQQFQYAFDDIGNRTSTQAGGDTNGWGLRYAGYSANNLNQYTARDVPGAVDVMGLALATNAVTVNGQTASRKGEYFRRELAVTNATTPLWTNISIAAAGETTVSGHQFVPKTQEQFGYDSDGNLTSDGRWTYSWDAENRLASLVARTTVGPQQLIKFEYDPKGRRIHKQVWNNTGGTGTAALDLKFLYDGWNLAADLNGTNNNVIRAYLWGLDLSGSLQGAGGIGGLLKVAYTAAGTTNCFVAYDANGNVAMLADGGSSTNLAQYGYGPFGEVLRATGPTGKANPFRFSTKYQDDETDFAYYGYRYYNPSAGRWIARDPGEEDVGGANLYSFVGGDAVNHDDAAGLWVIYRDRSENWASVFAEPGDTVQSLADLTHLDVADARKWLRGWSGGQITPCAVYEIPNTVVVYTSKRRWYEYLGGVVNGLRRLAVLSGRRYERHNYHVIYQLGKGSDKVFEDLWTTDGIFAFAMGGHGAGLNGLQYGFEATPGSGWAVGPDQVKPPYKLQAVGAYFCSSALPVQMNDGSGNTILWRSLVSHSGTFVGFDADIGWDNIWWHEVDVNQGLIPP